MIMESHGPKSDRFYHSDKLLIQGPWNKDLESYVIGNRVEAICLNRAFGWRGDNLDFLFKLKHLKCIEILDREIRDVSALNQLGNIETMDLYTECKATIDFTGFNNLKRCSLVWQKGYESIFDTKNLEYLNLTSFSEKTLSKVLKLNKLKYLRLFKSVFENLDGIENLKGIKELELVSCKKLCQLDSVGRLSKLEKLRIQLCKKIADVTFIQYLANLKQLILDNLGDIESLLPIKGLSKLQFLSFIESTNILDGDVGFIDTLPKLKKKFYIQRRHYH